MLVMLRISGQASDLPARLLPGSTMPLTRPGHDFPVDAGFFRLMPLVWQVHSVQRCPLNVVLCRQIFTTAKAEVVRLLVWLGTDASMPEQRERAVSDAQERDVDNTQIRRLFADIQANRRLGKRF